MRYLTVILSLIGFLNFSYSADYYWVGGTGEWSDITHWAKTSGGTDKWASTPTKDDNVIFDDKSFTSPGQVISVTTDIIFCNNMDWSKVTNMPRFSGTFERRLNIFGSLNLSANMIFDFQGEINFLSDQSGNSIQFNGHKVFTNLNFNGIGGQWELAGDIKVDSTISFLRGQLNTKGFNITSSFLDILPSSPVTILLDKSVFTITGNTRILNYQEQGSARITNNNLLTINPGTSKIIFKGTKVIVDVLGTQAFSLNELIFESTVGKSLISQLVASSSIKINKSIFNNDTKILGTLDFGDLVLGSGHLHEFQSGKVYKMNSLTALGTCISPIQIFSTESGVQTTFSSNGITKVEYATIKDVRANETGIFSATNSVNLGSNPNWTISVASLIDLYWVNGSGNWNDPNHWATTSGGEPGACIPTANANVHFDQNSFTSPSQSVEINVPNAICRNMNWIGATGNPILKGRADHNLRIYGNLNFIQEMQLDFDGDVYFESGQVANTLTSGNQLFKKNVFFNNSTGGWTLMDSLKVYNTIYFNRGVITTANNFVRASRFHSDNENTRRLNLDNSTIELLNWDFGIYHYEKWLVRHKGLTLNEGRSLIKVYDGSFTIWADGFNTEYYDLEFPTWGAYRDFGSERANFNKITYRSNGLIDNSVITGTLELTKGGELTVNQNKTVTLTSLIANGDCEGMISIKSSISGITAFFSSSSTISTNYLILKDISIAGTNGFFTANNSIDLGNNNRWTINNLSPRKLFWVGNSGSWEDKSHWTLISGTPTPGGECIPTPVDTVIFDDKSFNISNGFVDGYRIQNNCRVLDASKVINQPKFNLSNLQIYGSIYLKPNLPFEVFQLRFRTEATNEKIQTFGAKMVNTYFESYGEWTLESKFYSRLIDLVTGTLNTNNYELEMNSFQSYTHIRKGLNLANSKITINGDYYYYDWFTNGDSLIINPGTSNIEFKSADAIVYNYSWPGANQNKYNFHNVIFSALTGISTWLADPLYVQNFNSLTFNNDGKIDSKIKTDTLIFSPGKSYFLRANETQTVQNYWQIRGNNCTPIELSSTQPGIPSTVFMPTGSVQGEFIQMRDQRTSGGATFYAGAYSSNISNNQGWQFQPRPGFADVGFLGEDKVLCQGLPLVIDANNKSPNETYLWSNNSTNSTLTVNTGGLYFVTVNFSNGCSITDSINILNPTNFQPDLGGDQILCQGDSILLNASLGIPTAQFKWHDNSTDSTFLVTQPGQVKVTVDIGGCFASDSILVSYTILPKPDLGRDTTLCFGDSIIISFDKTNFNPSVGFIWENKETQGPKHLLPSFSINSADTLKILVNDGSCFNSDTVIINYYPEIKLNLGGNKQICEGESLTLVTNTNFPSGYFLWSTGETTPSITVNTENSYKVTVTVNNCQASDSMDLEVNLKPIIDLGKDTSLCVGESITLTPGNPSLDPNTTLIWNNGVASFGPTLIINSNSKVFLSAISPDNCEAIDSINITFQPFPIISLDPTYESCEGQSIPLNVSNTGATYLWQPLGTTGATQDISTPGKYSVEVSLNGCSKKHEFEAFFKPLPVYDLGNDTTLCDGEALSISLAGSGDSYLWSNGSTMDNIIISKADTLRVSVTQNGCSKQDEIKVTFKPNPIVNLGNDVTLCQGEILSLSSTTPGAKYTWNDGTTDSILLVGFDGNYHLEVDLNGCIKSDTIEVTFNPLPVFDLGNDTLLCSGETIGLSANIPGGSYNWLNPSGNINSSITVSNKGTYILNVTLNGCSSRDSIFVDYVNLTNNFLGVNQSVCEGEQIDINISYTDHPGAQYLWDNFSSLPTRSITQSGTYSATITLGRCIANDSVSYVFNELPSFNLGPDLRLCEDETVDLIIDVDNALQYLWNDRSTMDQRTVRFPGGLIWGEARRNNCVFRDSVLINYDQIPKINLGPDTTICADRSVLLKAGADAERYIWQDGSTKPTLLAENGGIYRLEAINGVCSAVDSVVITATECFYFNVYVPNAFSPNNDGVNDELLPFVPPQIQVISFEMNIFDRWGNLVFKTTDPTFSWDGRWNGKEMPIGVYIYSLQMEYIDDLGPGQTRRRGDFMLLK